MRGYRKGRNWRWFNFAIGISSGAILLYFLISSASAEHIQTILGNISQRSILLYALLSIVGLLLRSLRYRLLVTTVIDREQVETDSVPSLWSFICITGVRNAFVDFLPARLGELTYLYCLRRFGCSLATASTSFALALFFDLLVLAGIVATSLYFWSDLSSSLAVLQTSGITEKSHPYGSILLVVIAVMMLVALFAIGGVARRMLNCVGFLRERFKRFRSPRMSAIAQFLFDVTQEVSRFDSLRDIAKIFLLTVGLRIAKYGSLIILLFGAIDSLDVTVSSVPVAGAVIAFVMAEGAASLPVSGIMGFGTYEAVWSLVFAQSGIVLSAPHIVAIAFSVHLLTQIVGYAIGILSIIILTGTRSITSKSR